MTTSMNRQPQGIPVGGQFATTAHSEPEGAIPAPAATSGPEFEETMRRVEGDFHAARRQVQHGYMVMTVNAMRERCPNVASFTLVDEDDLEARDILDADGEEVSDEEHDAMQDIIADLVSEDCHRYVGEEINLQEILDTWKP